MRDGPPLDVAQSDSGELLTRQRHERDLAASLHLRRVATLSSELFGLFGEAALLPACTTKAYVRPEMIEDGFRVFNPSRRMSCPLGIARYRPLVI